MEEPMPYLIAALLCERVIEEKDGSLSIIRLADKITITIPAETTLRPKPVIALTGLVSLKGGDFSGKGTLSIIKINPKGEREPPKSQPALIDLKGAEQGINTILRMEIGVEQEGVHWFEVLFNNHMLTRIPLTVVYKQVEKADIQPPTQDQI